MDQIEKYNQPERIPVREAAKITGRNLRTVQHYAKKGLIPGAALLMGRWTFDEVRLRAWVKGEEQKCQKIYINEAQRGGDVLPLPEASIEEAYARAIGLRPKSASKLGVRR